MSPRQRSTNRSKPLVLGFIGDGSVTNSYLTGALDQLVGDRDEVSIVLPITDDSYNDSMAMVLDWADANKIDFEGVVDETTSKDKELKAIAADAVKTTKTTVVGEQVVKLLDSSDIEGRLIVFWEVDDEGVGAADATSALEAADTADIPTYDICNGMELFTFNDPGESTPADEDNVPDPEPVRRRRGRAAEEDTADAGELPSAEALAGLGVVALKNLAKKHLGSTPADLKGLSKEDLLEMLSGDMEPADEAQSIDADNMAPGVSDAEGDVLLASFADARAAYLEATGALVDALMASFKHEMNKPRSAGRPRKDGTAAQSRKPRGEEQTGEEDTSDQGDEPDEDRPTRRRRGGRSV